MKFSSQPLGHLLYHLLSPVGDKGLGMLAVSSSDSAFWEHENQEKCVGLQMSCSQQQMVDAGWSVNTAESQNEPHDTEFNKHSPKVKFLKSYAMFISTFL